MLIILVIIVLRIVYFHKTELGIWLPGVIGLAFVLFIEANDTLMIDKYLISAVAFTYALVSSANMIQIDKNKKFSIYYTFGALMMALFTAFTIHFGGTVNSVLTKPLFLTLMLISLCVIIIVPIIALIIYKANIHILWGALGWIIVVLAGWGHWSVFTGEFTSRALLLISILCLALNFLLADWNTSKNLE